MKRVASLHPILDVTVISPPDFEGRQVGVEVPVLGVPFLAQVLAHGADFQLAVLDGEALGDAEIDPPEIVHLERLFAGGVGIGEGGDSFFLLSIITWDSITLLGYSVGCFFFFRGN